MSSDPLPEPSPEPVDFAAGAPTSQGSLDVRWCHGARPGSGNSDPKMQVYRYDEHTFVLPQGKTVSYEAPFLYLLFGNARALLLDTGATAQQSRCPVRQTVDHLMTTWLRSHPRTSCPLVVSHSHGHRDHIAGDAQFEGRPDTTVAGKDRSSVMNFFGFANWPDEVLQFDLGGRVLEITGTAGHDVSSISILDACSGFLLTGDLVYPVWLYVQDMAAFTDSLDRMLRPATSGHVRHVMGAHIEMSRTPGPDYPLGTTFQPGEPPLQMSIDQLGGVWDGAVSVDNRPGAHVFDEFAIFNRPCRLAIAHRHQRVRRVWRSLCRS